MISSLKLKNVLNQYQNIKIAVIGDLMLDFYIKGDALRLSPEAPVPIVDVKEEFYVLGGAANVVNNLHSLGVRVYPLGIIGEDLNGELLKNELINKTVFLNGILFDKKRPTIVKKRIVANHQQIVRLDWEVKTPIEAEFESEIVNSFQKIISDIDGVILSDYDKGLITPFVAKEIIKLANRNNKPVVVDPKPINIKSYYGATSMTPNRKEAIDGLRKIDINFDSNEITEVGKLLKEKLNLNNLLLTRSQEGMTLFSEDITHIHTYAREVYDVSGAGDTVISAYLSSFLAGASWIEAANIANIAAGIVVGKLGTATTNINEIEELYLSIFKNYE